MEIIILFKNSMLNRITPTRETRHELFSSRQAESGLSKGIRVLVMDVRFFLSLVMVLLLTGCAGMSQQECAVTDWRTVGYEDGARGVSQTHIASYRKSCSKHGVAPDLDAYRAGHADGVEVFCQPGNGFNVGSSGRNYQGVCPAHMEDEFLRSYNAGRELHRLRAALNRTTGQIAYRERELQELGEELKLLTAELIANGTAPDRRIMLVVETRELAEEQGKLESEIRALERDRATLQEQLSSYEASLAYDY